MQKIKGNHLFQINETNDKKQIILDKNWQVLNQARIGDLSGIAGTPLVLGETNPGFGLASQNVYLTGGIIATFGKIADYFEVPKSTVSERYYNYKRREALKAKKQK